jgi:vacuolar-type H+-ATPase subunit E/Vma4
MAKEEVINKITQDLKDKATAIVNDLKTKVAAIEEAKVDLIEKGVKASIGRIRKNAQELKKSAQQFRILTIQIRDAINKK